MFKFINSKGLQYYLPLRSLTDRVALRQETALYYVDTFLYFSFLLMVFFMPLFETWKNLWFACALLAWVVRMAITRDFRVKLYPAGLGHLAFLGAACISALFAINLFQGLRGVWDIFRALVVYLVVVNTFEKEKQVHLCLAVFLLSITLGSAWGLFGYYTSGDRFLEIHSLGYKNHTATYLAIVLSLCGGLLAANAGLGLHKVFLLGVMTVVGWALLMTQSRGAWVALAIVYVTFFMLVRRWRSWLNLGVFIVFLVLISSGYQPVRERMETLARSPFRNNTLVVRAKSWSNTFRLIRDHPIVGVGPRNFDFIDHGKYNLVGWNHAHSLYINTTAEMGGLGVAALFGWLASCWVTLRRARRHCRSANGLGYWLGALGALLIIMTSGIVATTLHTEGFMALTLLLGIAVVANVNDESQTDSRARWAVLSGRERS